MLHYSIIIGQHRFTSIDIANQICATDGELTGDALRYLNRIESLEKNGEQYSNESFDVLCGASRFIGIL
jgi:hypothetical protein